MSALVPLNVFIEVITTGNTSPDHVSREALMVSIFLIVNANRYGSTLIRFLYINFGNRTESLTD